MTYQLRAFSDNAVQPIPAYRSHPLYIGDKDVYTDFAYFHLDANTALKFPQLAKEVDAYNTSGWKGEDIERALCENDVISHIYSCWHIANNHHIQAAIIAANTAFSILNSIVA